MNVSHIGQQQLADRWGVSCASLERWRSVGIGPPFMKIGARVRYRLEDIEAYEQNSLRKSSSECISGENEWI